MNQTMIKKFDALIELLNAEDSFMAQEFRKELEDYVKAAEEDAEWCSSYR